MVRSTLLKSEFWGAKKLQKPRIQKLLCLTFEPLVLKEEFFIQKICRSVSRGNNMIQLSPKFSLDPKGSTADLSHFCLGK